MRLLLDGDNFAATESKEEEEAQKRRNRRRQRLAELDNEQQKMKKEETSIDTSTINNDNIRVENEKNAVPDPSSEALSESDLKKGDTKIEASEPDSNLEIVKKNDDDDYFDMFSSPVSPVGPKENMQVVSLKAQSTTSQAHQQRDWDDVEGYYKTVIGETIDISITSLTATQDESSNTHTTSSTIGLKVSGLVGKGVFSTVLKCTTLSNASSVELPPTVAIKCVRHNETMAKAASNEIQFLQQLKGSRGIVPLLLPSSGSPPLEHRGHVLLVFPYFEYSLRFLLQKFGNGVGLSLQAVRSYFGQLFAAASHLKKHGIIHADLKPDNILVSGDFSTVQLADFGSAFEASSPGSQPTPYLVSRFYRAPEIILGLVPTIAIDLWSLAVTVAEVFMGDVLFRGKSNNDMLYVFMQHMGPFSNRVIRQHMVQCQKMPNIIPQQFKQEGTNYCFAQQVVDPISGEPFHKIHSLLSNNSTKTKFPSATPLHQKILKAKSSTDSRTSVMHFSDLLQKCLALDSTRRIALKDALQHPFFQPEES